MIKNIGFLPLMLLVGCSSYETRFGCGLGEGLTCASMDKVHRALERDEVMTWDVKNLGPHTLTKDQQHQRAIHLWVASSPQDGYVERLFS